MFSFESITSHFIYFAGGVSLLISMSELLVRRRRLENYIFCALLFSFGMLMFQIGFIVDAEVTANPRLLYLHLAFLYLVGPIGYFAYFLIILPRDTLPARMMVYLVPATAALAFDAWYMLMPAESQAALLSGFLYGGDTPGLLPVRLLIAGAGLQIAVYLGALFVRFLLIWIREGRAPVLLLSMGYLVYTVAASELVIAGYWFASTVLLKRGCLMMALLFVGAFLVSQRFPKFLQLIIDETEKKYRSKSLLAGLDVDDLIARLKLCMDVKKMFMNDELTLKDLAGELSVTVHQLSQVLNERMATNFSNFVNQYRINESRELLVSQPDRSVLSIAYAVGFNTKSSFYNSFSRITGTTPQDYRREKL